MKRYQGLETNWDHRKDYFEEVANAVKRLQFLLLNLINVNLYIYLFILCIYLFIYLIVFLCIYFVVFIFRACFLIHNVPVDDHDEEDLRCFIYCIHKERQHAMINKIHQGKTGGKRCKREDLTLILFFLFTNSLNQSHSNFY